MVDINLIKDPLLQALIPLVKTMTGGSGSLASVAAILSAQLKRPIGPKDVADALRLLSQMKGAPWASWAGQALNSANLALEASAIAAEQAAAQAAAAGLEQAAVQAARQKAVEAALSQPLREVAKRSVMQSVTEALTAAARTARTGAFLGLSAAAWWLLGLGIVALGVGGYIYSRGDEPIQPRPAISQPKPTSPTADTGKTQPKPLHARPSRRECTKIVTTCAQYANVAVDQYNESVQRGCGYEKTDARRWHTSRADHDTRWCARHGSIEQAQGACEVRENELDTCYSRNR